MSKYTRDIQQLASMFKALSNPQRLRIFLKLAASCAPGCCVSDPAEMRQCVGALGADLDVAASTVSHHLKELRQAGLMQVERRGQKIECWISEDALRTLRSFFGGAPAASREVPPVLSKGGTRCRKKQVRAAPARRTRPAATAPRPRLASPRRRRSSPSA